MYPFPPLPPGSQPGPGLPPEILPPPSPDVPTIPVDEFAEQPVTFPRDPMEPDANIVGGPELEDLVPELDPMAPEVLEAPGVETPPEEEAPEPPHKEAFSTFLRTLEDEDQTAREYWLRNWKELDYLWHGFHYFFWDDRAGALRVPTQNELREIDAEDIDIARVINIYKAHGESVIAALTINTPSVAFYPADADSLEDLLAAKTREKVGELLQRRNRAPLQFAKATFQLWNQSYAAGYVYRKQDRAYGTRTEDKILGFKTEVTQNPICPQCASPMMPGVACQNCGYEAAPVMDPQATIVPISEKVEVDKYGVAIEVFGSKNVRIASYARNQADTPFLILEFEQHRSLTLSQFAGYRAIASSDRGTDEYARNIRTPSAVPASYESLDKLDTIKFVWFRQCVFELSNDDAEREALITAYPDGAMCAFVNNTLVKVEPSSLDAHWRLTEDPLDDHIHADPKGKVLVDIQHMTNDLANTTLQTVQHGITQTFADPSVLDFQRYKEEPARPGSVFPTIPQSGKRISDGFFETRTAVLSQEVKEFAGRLEAAAQFCVGSFPSIYGGPNVSGSRTASEYQMSRDQALQRLSTVWKNLSFWWVDVIANAVELQVRIMREFGQDEIEVKKAGSTFINSMIKIEDLIGRIGKVEPENVENFPISMAKKRDMILDMMKNGDDQIKGLLYHPQNTALIAQLAGFPGLFIPGEGDRNKQSYEIQILLKNAPTQPPPPEMQPPSRFGNQMQMPEQKPSSSVPLDPTIDNDEIHIEVIKAWATSDEGLLAKLFNEAGYANVMAHLQEHMDEIARDEAAAMQQQPQEPQGGNNGRGNTGQPA